MSLSAGTRFGPFEIVEAIGAGGMGEVYRATDTNLKRAVAIKVLPESLAKDENRLARFQREAEVLAALNHPNVAHIYGLERSDDTTALVMELVEGPTLADRIAQGPIPADEALQIGMQIADGLEAAHSRGIVHRDLKPANIKLRPDGTVKVLDFGIAKALDVRTTNGPEAASLTTPAMTQAGLVLGTAAYMSPEQARGKPVDLRADIWAFGCVLFEMLTGQPAFGGEEITITLARVLERDAALGSLPGAISPAIRHTIKLCLEKDPNRRIADMRDLRLSLQGAFVPTELFAIRSESPTGRSLRHSARSSAAALSIGALLAGLVAWTLWPASETALLNSFDFDIPADHTLRATGRPVFALSPDGRHFAYNAAQGFYVRLMNNLEARLLPETGAVSTTPTFSPDGQSLAYWEFAGQVFKRVALSGGSPVPIGRVPVNPLGMSWGSDGKILFGQPDGIYSVPADGGTPTLLIPTNGQELYYGPQLLLDGDSVLFTVADDALDWNESRVVVQSLSTGERRNIAERGSDARYLPSGHIVYASGTALFGIAFDLDILDTSGGPISLVQGLMRATANLTGAANYGISADGTLAYLTGQRATGLRTLVWVDRDGNEQEVEIPHANYTSGKISPDGRRVVLDTFDEDMDIWIWSFETGLRRQITRSETLNGTPIWSRDGNFVLWSRASAGTMQEVYRQAATGGGTPQPVTTRRSAVSPTDVTPDGHLLYSEFLPPKDIWSVPVDGPPSSAVKLIATAADEFNATVSRGGRWLAYQSDRTGQSEIYVSPFPDVDTAIEQITSNGGTMPVWSKDGTELYYYVDRGNSGAFMAVRVQSDPSFEVIATEELFEGPYFPPLGIAAPSTSFYDVGADGRFLIIRNVATDGDADRTQIPFVEPPQVIIIQNWVDELERLVPAQ